MILFVDESTITKKLKRLRNIFSNHWHCCGWKDCVSKLTKSAFLSSSSQQTILSFNNWLDKRFCLWFQLAFLGQRRCLYSVQTFDFSSVSSITSFFQILILILILCYICEQDWLNKNYSSSAFYHKDRVKPSLSVSARVCKTVYPICNCIVEKTSRKMTPSQV